jgi:hypothetical protein
MFIYNLTIKLIILAIFTFLLYFIALIIRSNYNTNVQNLEISTEIFTDFSHIHHLKNSASNFNCMVILFFFFAGVMMHLTKLSEELRLIVDSMVYVKSFTFILNFFSM